MLRTFAIHEGICARIEIMEKRMMHSFKDHISVKGNIFVTVQKIVQERNIKRTAYNTKVDEELVQ